MHQDKLREKEFNDELEEIRTEINPPKQPKDMTKAECLEAFIVQSEASLRALQESAKLPEDRQSEKSIAIFMNGEAQDAEDVYFNFSGFEVVDMKYNFERHNIEQEPEFIRLLSENGEQKKRFFDNMMDSVAQVQRDLAVQEVPVQAEEQTEQKAQTEEKPVSQWDKKSKRGKKGAKEEETLKP